MTTGVYTITNKVDNKMIVGSGIINARKNSHFRLLENNDHCNSYLQRAYNKYGKENFVFEVVEECEPEFCISNELYWMNMLDTKNPEKGYNMETPGKGRVGVKLTEEHKKKIGDANRGKSLPTKGIKYGEERGLKISLAKKGRPSYRPGYKHSAETRMKISIGNKGKLHLKKAIFNDNN